MPTAPYDEIDDDLFSPNAIADPYAYLGHIREVEPVHWNEQLKVWIVTRYEDVAWVSRRPNLFSSAVMVDDGRPPYPPIAPEDEAELAYVKLNLRDRITLTDPPDHRTRRAALQPFFTVAASERWRHVIRSACATLLDAVQDRREMDVMTDFAVPLPLNVISELMAIPPDDRPWVRSVAEHLLIGPRTSASRISELAEAMRSMIAYIEPLAAARRESPGDDLISLVMTAEREGAFTRNQAVQNIILLVVAGHETTINLICNGMLAFIKHPGQWDRLRADPTGLAPSATEECLRYDPPVKSLERVATEDVRLGEHLIRAGDRVRWFISSANRDPDRFERPDTFDISRTPNAHVSFGHGIHLCLGAALARIEGQEVFGAMAQRFERLSLQTDPVQYAPAIDLRSVTALSVSW